MRNIERQGPEVLDQLASEIASHNFTAILKQHWTWFGCRKTNCVLAVRSLKHGKCLARLSRVTSAPLVSSLSTFTKRQRKHLYQPLHKHPSIQVSFRTREFPRLLV